MLLGILLLQITFGTVDFIELKTLVPNYIWVSGTSFLTVIGLLLFIGPIGKSGQFPLHVWLPDAMEGPTPVSALIHAATMVVAGVYLIGRAYFIFAELPVVLHVIAWLGGFTAFFAATIAITQRPFKRILAYSTISQLGYMMLALGVGSLTASMFHLMTHAFFKALMFLCAGAVIEAMHEEADIFKMGGLRHRMPVTFKCMAIGVVAIAGLPPFAGFFSKDAIRDSRRSRGGQLPAVSVGFGHGVHDGVLYVAAAVCGVLRRGQGRLPRAGDERVHALAAGRARGAFRRQRRLGPFCRLQRLGLLRRA